MKQDRRSEEHVLGEVEAEGVTYFIHQVGGNTWQVVRRDDRRRVGTLRGSPSLMWRLEAEDIDHDLLRSIVRLAIEDGLLKDLPTD
jgi:hypothetical protein